MSDLVFRRNLLAISGRSPEAADRLDAADPDPRLVLRAAKSGAPVPAIAAEGRETALHSLMDPLREGARLAEAMKGGGFVVALGLGAAYALKPQLASTETSGILVIEYGAGLLRGLLELLDLSEFLSDARVQLILDPDEEELSTALLQAYVPPLCGDLRVIPLRARVESDPRFPEAGRIVKRVLDRISEDYSVQAFFGKLWYANAVRNLFLAERPLPPLPPVRRAVVAAAGPSLEEAIPRIAAEQAAGAFLIATDTSLPALTGRGLRPGAVVSIDCQTISYYHFLKGIPRGVPLVLDLASPSRLARMSDSVRFFSSGHPFCAYLSARFRPFPALDTSGGNVTHAALSLAEALGAESALLAGADFSYPEGKSYARGTYIYDYFERRSRRVQPMEGHFAGFVFRNPNVAREGEPGSTRSWRYVTKPLMSYKSHLERFAALSPLEVRPLPGKGVEIQVERAATRGSRGSPALFSAGKAAMGAADFLESYARDLRALPAPYEPARVYLAGLKAVERDLWTTLLPAASAFQRQGGGLRGAALLEATREWSLAQVEEALAAR